MTDRLDAPHLLLTAGPTWEPIDAVRYLGNRSSGKLGVALADEAARRGWPVTLLLGPTALRPKHPGVSVEEFQTTADLEGLLARFLPEADILIMAAAVADYRPAAHEVDEQSKRRRKGSMTLELESTPDLLRGCADRRRPDQLLIGFALEPAETMLESAAAKLARKQIDAIVANPLGTMGADQIEATLVVSDRLGASEKTPGAIGKPAFARWLLDRAQQLSTALRHSQAAQLSQSTPQKMKDR